MATEVCINNSPCILTMKGRIPIEAVLAGFTHFQQPGCALLWNDLCYWWPEVLADVPPGPDT